MQIKVKQLSPLAVLPKYQTKGAACFDLHAATEETVVVSSTSIVGTGLAFEIPKGHVMLVFGRSGSAFKNDTRLSNCVGVIDSDFRGEVKVKLTRDANNFTDFLVVEPSDRIAQGMIVPIPHVELVEIGDLEETERGTGGFGSTGSN